MWYGRPEIYYAKLLQGVKSLKAEMGRWKYLINCLEDLMYVFFFNDIWKYKLYIKLTGSSIQKTLMCIKCI